MTLELIARPPKMSDEELLSSCRAYLKATHEIQRIGKLDPVDPACIALSPDGRWLLVTKE